MHENVKQVVSRCTHNAYTYTLEFEPFICETQHNLSNMKSDDEDDVHDGKKNEEWKNMKTPHRRSQRAVPRKIQGRRQKCRGIARNCFAYMQPACHRDDLPCAHIHTSHIARMVCTCTFDICIYWLSFGSSLQRRFSLFFVVFISSKV